MRSAAALALLLCCTAAAAQAQAASAPAPVPSPAPTPADGLEDGSSPEPSLMPTEGPASLPAASPPEPGPEEYSMGPVPPRLPSPEERSAAAPPRVIVKYKDEDAPRVIDLPPSQSPQAVAAQQAAQPEVEYAEPDQILYITAANPPNDPLEYEQWHLPQVDAYAAWETSTGSAAVKVCVVDTGVKYNHPDLRDNMVTTRSGQFVGKNTYSDTPDFMDDNGHGTHCAGILGAVGNNNRGVAGINWRVGILPCKFMDRDGRGYLSDAVDCINWCTDQGADIISASFGSQGTSTALRKAIADFPGLFVTAAGNEEQNLEVPSNGGPFIPATYDLPNLVTVAASGRQDELAEFSNFSPRYVHLAAPGVEIYSTYTPSYYKTLSGTSMATPLVAGAAALALAAAGGSRTLSVPTLRTLLLNSTDPAPDLQGFVATGGRLNVARLLEQVVARNGSKELPEAAEELPLQPLTGAAAEGEKKLSSKTVTIIIIASAAGGCVALLASTFLLVFWIKRARQRRQAALEATVGQPPLPGPKPTPLRPQIMVVAGPPAPPHSAHSTGWQYAGRPEAGPARGYAFAYA